MRQKFSTAVLSFLVLHLSSFATIHTVSNVPSTIAQFNTIQAASDAAESGDTIYVHGSPNAYAAFTISFKKLTVIGPGWSPNKNLPFTAIVNGMTITGAACSGSEIQGLVLTSSIIINSQRPDNIRFIRNRFSSLVVSINQQSVTYSGYLFEGNWFDNSAVAATSNSTYQNFLFQNNLFIENGCCVSSNVAGFVNSVNVLFNHNLWYGPNIGNTRSCFGSNCRFLLLTNNIFVNRNPAENNSLSTFTNNITFNAGTNNPWAVNSNVDGGGNVTNQSPLMVAQASVNNGTNDPLLDFTIAAGPANNSATDGKDMGLLYDATGSLNWVNSRGSRLPFIFSMNITNPTIAEGGSLEVKVEARKNN
jgi:hypothetical protein